MVKTGTSTLQIQKGFSLIEVMVVLCIISVLVGFGSVSFRPLWQKHQLSLAVKELQSELELTRINAIIENKTFQFSTEPGIARTRKKNNVGWTQWHNKQFDETVTVLFSGNLYFYGKGFASPKTITIIREELRQQLVINVNGRIRRNEIQ